MRNILVVAHTRREDSLAAALSVSRQLVEAGISPVMTAEDLSEFRGYAQNQDSAAVSQIKSFGSEVSAEEIELAMVLGGDGTILKAAEIARDFEIPIMGINLGHVGFLAESERDELASSVAHAVSRNYVIKERMTLNVDVFVGGQKVFSTWALNEATVEKSARERMLEVVIEVEGSPLSSFGCDGIVISTPTGSTAYAFSAGGPVVWPEVEAILMVPLSAHALFSRPMVIKPSAIIAVEVLQRSAGHGILWCDGRRSWELPPGARVEVSRASASVKLARLRESSFTERLVRKFSLPVSGWRGTSNEVAR